MLLIYGMLYEFLTALYSHEHNKNSSIRECCTELLRQIVREPVVVLDRLGSKLFVHSMKESPLLGDMPDPPLVFNPSFPYISLDF